MNNVNNTHKNIFPSVEISINMSLPSDKFFIMKASKYFASFLQVSDFERFASMQIAFEEALTNAMFHGNNYDINKYTHIFLYTDRNRIKVVIEDEGEGFDYVMAMIRLTESQEDVYQSSGRGLFLISMYTDDFYFEENGKRIILIKKRADEDG